MTAADFARKLLEVAPLDVLGAKPSTGTDRRMGKDQPMDKKRRVDPKVKVLQNRINLQIFSVPSLQSYLVDMGIVNQEDGTAAIQLDFLRLPEEVIPQLERLVCADEFKEHKFTRYIKNGQAHTGLTLIVDPDEIEGDAYDYAY